MMVSLIYQFTCQGCSAPAKGLMVHTVRVNKGSLRPVGSPGLGFMPRGCEGCGVQVELVPDRVCISDDDLPKVNAYRARKGWPELTTADVLVRAREEVDRGAA